jgi:hypothetical protein
MVMEAYDEDNAALPAVAAIGIIALVVLASIAMYLVLSAR